MIATFKTLSLFIALVVNAMQTQHEDAQGMSDREAIDYAHAEREMLLNEVRAMRGELAHIRSRLDDGG